MNWQAVSNPTELEEWIEKFNNFEQDEKKEKLAEMIDYMADYLESNEYRSDVCLETVIEYVQKNKKSQAARVSHRTTRMRRKSQKRSY